MGKEDKHPACLYVCVFEFVVRASKQVAAMTVMVTVVMVMMGVVEKEKEGERRGKWVGEADKLLLGQVEDKSSLYKEGCMQ